MSDFTLICLCSLVAVPLGTFILYCVLLGAIPVPFVSFRSSPTRQERAEAQAALAEIAAEQRRAKKDKKKPPPSMTIPEEELDYQIYGDG